MMVGTARCAVRAPQRGVPTSNIQKHSRLPAALRSLDREIVKRHRFHIRALMMSFRIERFALGRCLHKINFISFVDLHFSDA